jgi:phosphomannomutase
VRFPNPEEPGTLDRALALAREVGADLVLANDPDADRLAVALRESDGALRTLSGNEVGILLGHYVLTRSAPMAERPLVVTTIVSSPQLGVMARELGALYEETLTGFKWIANRALKRERSAGARFLFGYEEALGYTLGSVVRDKDGIGAALAFADLAGWCRSAGLTVRDYLGRIQRAHGLYLAAQRSVTLAGAQGATVMAGIMRGMRTPLPRQIGSWGVTVVRDYQRQLAIERGLETPLALPVSNVLAFELEGGARITLRPSGTEPKIKYYFDLRVDLGPRETVAEAEARGQERLAELVEAFLALVGERGRL